MAAKRRQAEAKSLEREPRRSGLGVWPFYLLAVLTPISFCPHVASPTTVKFLIICLLAVPVLFLLCREVSTGSRFPMSALLLPALAMFGWKAISAAYGDHFYSSVEPLANAAIYLIFFFGAALLPRGQAQRIRILYALAYGAISVAVIGVLEHYGLRLPRMSDPTLGRIFSTMGNPTFLAAYLALVLPTQIGLFFLAERKTHKWALGAATALCYLCVIWTYTRGIWLGLMLSAVVMAVLVAKTAAREAIATNRKRLAVLSLVLVTVTAFAWGTHQYPTAKSRQVENTKFAVRESDTIRKTLWGAGIAMFKQKPALGWGLGGYRAYQLNFISHKPVPGKYDMGEDHSHNDFIETAADQGLPGLAIYAWLLIAIAWSASTALRRAARDSDPSLALITVALLGGVMAYFGDVMVNVSIHEVYVGVFFWLLLGILAGSSAADGGKQDKTRRTLPFVAGFWAIAAIVAVGVAYYGVVVFTSDLHTYKAGVARDHNDAELFLRENQAALKAYPFATRPMYWIGMAYLDAGYPEDALKALSLYQRRYPHANRIGYELGRTYFSLGQDQASIRSYRDAVKFDPNNFQTWLGLAAVCSASKEYKLADRAASKAVALGSSAEIASYYESAPLHNEPGLAHYLVANELLRSGRDGTLELRKAIREAPKNAHYLTILGAVYVQMAMRVNSTQATDFALAQAKQVLGAAIAIDPTAPDAHGYLASAYLQEGHKAEARAELQKAISLTSDPTRLASFKQMLAETQ